MSRRYSFWDLLAGIPVMEAEFERQDREERRVERQKERERQASDRGVSS